MLDLTNDIIDLGNSFSLKKVSEDDSYFDYEILKDSIKVGCLQVVDNDDNIFIRQIIIDEAYRNNHYATEVVNSLFKATYKNISLCVSLHSESAIAFWDNFLKDKNYENPKGTSYIIKK